MADSIDVGAGRRRTIAGRPKRRPRKRWSARRVVRWAVALGVVYLLFSIVDVAWASIRRTDASAPAAIVLGAAQYNGEPSAVLRARLDTSAELWSSGRVDLIVVTGGGQEADVTTEAKSGYNYLRETHGMSDEELRLEVQGSSTYESLAAAARFLTREGIGKVILVTDPYHARRSQLVAEEVGLEAEVYPTDQSPSVQRILREGLAVAVGRIASFRRVDTYLAGRLTT